MTMSLEESYSRVGVFVAPTSYFPPTPIFDRATPYRTDSFETHPYARPTRPHLVEIKLEKDARKRLKQEIVANHTRKGKEIGFVSGLFCSIVGIPLATICLGRRSSKPAIIAACTLASVGWVTGVVGAGIGAGVGQVAGRVKAARV